jgi:hypothetical protein
MSEETVKIKVIKKTVGSNSYNFVPISSRFVISDQVHIPVEHVGFINIINQNQANEKRILSDGFLTNKQNELQSVSGKFRFIPWKQLDPAVEEDTIRKLQEADKDRRLLLEFDVNQDGDMSGVIIALKMLLRHYRHVNDLANIDIHRPTSAPSVDLTLPDPTSNLAHSEDLVDWVTQCNTVLCAVPLAWCNKLRLLHNRVGGYVASHLDESIQLSESNLLMTSCSSSTAKTPFEALVKLLSSKYANVNSILQSTRHADDKLQQAYQNVDKDLIQQFQKKQKHEKQLRDRTGGKSENSPASVYIPVTSTGTRITGNLHCEREVHDLSSTNLTNSIPPSLTLVGNVLSLHSHENFVCGVYKIVGL